MWKNTPENVCSENHIAGRDHLVLAKPIYNSLTALYGHIGAQIVLDAKALHCVDADA